jgi:hypothetical protein
MQQAEMAEASWETVASTELKLSPVATAMRPIVRP